MKKYSAWLIFILWVALAVRLYQLTYHSLWFDEAISVYWARQAVPRILEVGFTLVEDRLPPLYYLLLKSWIALFGLGEAAVRGLSVAFGLLLVPLIAAIAELLWGRRVALLAAILVALNPFLIWYAQEARMYAPAAFFGALAIWAFLKICRAGGIGFVLLFIGAASAGLYSHLYTAFLLPALGLWLLVSYPRCRRLWLIFIGSGLIISLLFSPIALAIWRFSAESPAGSPLIGLPGRAWGLLQAFTIWKAPLSPLWQQLIPLGVGLFALLAFLPRFLTSRRADYNLPTSSRSISPALRNPRLLVTLLFLMPFIITNLLLLRNQLAFFGERYFIIMVPWLLLLAALGAHNLGKMIASEGQRVGGITYTSRFTFHPQGTFSSVARFIPYFLLFTLLFLPLPGQWTPPAAKEAWRQSVAYLAQHATAADAILIHPDWVRHPFQYYFKGPGQTYAAFSTVTAEQPWMGLSRASSAIIRSSG